MTEYNPKLIRNFSIIAHIDHGKSTLADRLLEATGTVTKREMQEQFLDDMDLEREKGITIKAHPVTMYYNAKDGNRYQLNIIDTPGHVDFSYEVSRSLSACEGALLIVDATQGVQAQTLANVFLALDKNLEILPVINKIDLPASNPEDVKKQIEDVIGLDTEHLVLASAKANIGIEEILEKIIQIIPPPKIDPENTLKALVFDSHYDNYKGVMAYIRVFSGEITKKSMIKFMVTNNAYEVLEVGIFSPREKPVEKLRAGETGYVVANIKDPKDIKIGDTITLLKYPAKEALPGFKIITPVVYAGIYPVDSTDFEKLKDALLKLKLNDSALFVEQESSHSLGFGFRCGFLGLLHLEIIFERLQREYDIDIITTAPSVVYKITLVSDKQIQIDNPTHYPDVSTIKEILEPYVKCHVMTPSEYLGAIMNLGMEKRGELKNTETLDSKRLLLTFSIPMNEILTDFNDKLKSVTRGYASFDYEIESYEKSDIIKLEIKVNEEAVDAFSCLVHRSKAEQRGRVLCEKLKELIPQQLFKVPIQAAIGGKIIARETISALSKNVTAKCYGGDITRKRKLWEKQKKGKKKMKEIGKVKIPSSVFTEILKND
ncbi:MAG: elongation factor 4 [Chlamydiae bacterium RIFCSPHIGHO2_12_FULL_27_8]|nr:MAG: elongation factor 4 [Chlamydiae bacterium RIFCSPHIGHO2_12_FULL_27_8]